MSRPRRSPAERLWERVDKTGECWLWTGNQDENGYGRIGLPGRQTVLVHRLAYELLRGPIPVDQQLDHQTTCPKNCVNPEHLRPVTHKQNQENRAGAQRNNQSSGVRGVTWDAKNEKWQVGVQHCGKRYHGGRYLSLEEAERAAVDLRNRLHTHNDVDRN